METSAVAKLALLERKVHYLFGHALPSTLLCGMQLRAARGYECKLSRKKNETVQCSLVAPEIPQEAWRMAICSKPKPPEPFQARSS